jgi:hypothetical protein
VATIKKVEQRTLDFIREVKRLKESAEIADYDAIMKITGIKSKSTISEILGMRQNIQPTAWLKFKNHFKVGSSENTVYAKEGSSTSAGKNTDKRSYEGDIEKLLSDIYQRLIRAEATNTVLAVTVAELSAKINGKSIASISRELSKDIDSEADRLFDLFGKKRIG